MIITIDGFSGQGKSTVARRVASELKMEYINSGNYYRAITCAWLHSGLTAKELSEGVLRKFLAGLPNDFFKKYRDSELRSVETTDSVAKIAAFMEVRKFVNKSLIQNTQHRNVVLDGRDMCTVFPNALCKFVIKADMDLRIVLAEKHDLTREQAMALIMRRDSEEQIIHYPTDSTLIHLRLGEGIDTAVRRINDIVLSKAIPVKSRWNISFCGNFLKAFIIMDSLPCTDMPVGENKIIMCPNEINFHKHETLMFMERYRPYIYGAVNKRLLEEIVTDYALSEVCVKNGWGFVAPAKKQGNYLKLSYPIPDYSLCANESGLEFLSAHGSKVVGIRAEFLHYYSYDTEHIKRILNRACERFEHVQLRLYDNTQPELEKNTSILNCQRGTVFVESNNDLYNNLIQLAEKCFRRYGNISLLLPYIKHESEALQWSTLIKEKFSGDVDIMLETPMMIMRFRSLVDYFSTYVIGVSDLISLIEGSDRQSISYEYDALACAANLIIKYVIGYMNNQTVLYITSEQLYQAIHTKIGNLKHCGSIRFMAKY